MANLNSKVYFLVCVLFLSYLPLNAHPSNGGVEKELHGIEEQYPVGGYNPTVATTITDYEVVNLTNTSHPVVWFKTSSLTEETYINVSGFYYSWSNYIYAQMFAYTSYERCVSQFFDVRYGSTNLCSNPSEDAEIYFVLDFSDTSSQTGSRVTENISLNISIGHKAPINQIVTPSSFADGDLYGDSTNWAQMESKVEVNKPVTIDGVFEGQYDQEYIEFTNQFQGTHEINVAFDGPVTWSSSDLVDCEESYNNGISTIFPGFNNIRSFSSFKNGFVFTGNSNFLSSMVWFAPSMDDDPILLFNETGTQYNSANILLVTDNWVYFSAESSSIGNELWRTDGTSFGTHLIADIYSGWSSSNPSSATEHNGKVFFSATTSLGTELWATDGTATGTYLVSDIYSGYSSSNPSMITSLGDNIYFSAYNYYGYKHIWKSDGLEGGVTEILTSSFYNSNPNANILKAHNGLLYFTATEYNEGSELWVSNGSVGNATMLTDYTYFSESSYSTYISDVYGHSNGNLYFIGRGQSDSYPSVRSTDGTISGTNIETIQQMSTYSKMQKIDETLYLTFIHSLNGTLDVFRIQESSNSFEYVASTPEHAYGEYYYYNHQLVKNNNQLYLSFNSNSNHNYNFYKINEAIFNISSVDVYPITNVYDWLSIDDNLLLFHGYSSNKVHVLDPGLSNEPLQTTITCEIHSSTSSIEFTPIARSLYYDFNDNSELLIGWTVVASMAPVRTIEDVKTGDSMRSNLPTPLSSDGFSYGNFHKSNDVDYYAVPIEHGSMQSIEIEAKYPLSVSLIGSHDCEIFSQDEIMFNLIFPYVSTIECNTLAMNDKITFSVGSNGYSHLKPQNHYKISRSFEMIDVFSNYLENHEVSEDIPSVGSSMMLQKGMEMEGSFFFSSDTIDQYNFDINEGEYLKFELLSNCATIKQQKSSYADHLYVSPFTNSGSHLFVDTADEENPFYTLEVERLYQSSATHPHIKERCDYKLSYDDVPESELPAILVTVNHEHRISLGETIQYDSFESNLDGVTTYTAYGYRMSMPIDLSPIKNGMIVATQSSGEPVNIQALAQSIGYVTGSSELLIGQNINVGLDYVQWKTLTLSNLDGSALTLSMTEPDLIQPTSRESNELYSRGIGVLGMSADEGYDHKDTWLVNNTDLATYYSIELKETGDDLQASFSNYGLKKMSVFSCGGSNQLTNDLYRKDGSGDYEIEIKKSYSGVCPTDVQIEAPYAISPDSNFRVKFNSNYMNEGFFEIIDEDFSTMYSTSLVIEDVWHPVSSISGLEPGSYFLVVRNADDVIVEERQLSVVDEVDLGVMKSDSVLGLQSNPKIQVIASNIHTYEPRNWKIDDLRISGFDNQNQPFNKPYDGTLEGFGPGVFTLDKIPDLLSGSELMVTGRITSDERISQFSLVWKVEFMQPTLTCESEFMYDSMNSHNQLLCMLTLMSKVHGSSTNTMAEQAIGGVLNVHNESGEIVMNVPFTTDYFAPTPIRINVADLQRYGNYTTTLTFVDESTFFAENTASFTVSGLFGEDVDQGEQISDFDLTILSIRNTATQGDTVNILWEVSGQDVNYLLTDVYVDNEIVYSVTESVQGREGTLSLKLPNSINPYNDHRINVQAVSEFGEIDTEFTILQGLPEQSQILVEIQPTKPTIGEDFSLNIVNPNGDKWLSWNWQLSVSGSVISTDEGFAERDKVSITIKLPVSQYTSNPVLEVWIETIDGSEEYKTLDIDPMPMRSVEFVLQDDLVKDESSEFEWKLQGIYLNKMDDVELIEVRMYSMSFDLSHKEQFVTKGSEGEGEISLPSTILPGTYNLVVEFTFADGTSYEHTQTAQVLESPNGINFFGLTIPPLAMGLDTILVIGLVIHAIVLHRWMRGKGLSKEDLDDEEEDDDDLNIDYDSLNGNENGQVQPMISLPETAPYSSYEQGLSDGLASIDKSNPDLYQEYPIGSGTYWYRNSPTDEWTMVS